MIVYLPFDVAYGYDALAILAIKRRSATTPEAARSVDADIRLKDEALRDAVGVAKHDAILMSAEYRAMLIVNQWLFTSFDWLHTAGLTAPAEQVKAHALEQDRVNGVDRPAAKRALQARWFAGAELTEQKLGYGTLAAVLAASTAAAEEREP